MVEGPPLRYSLWSMPKSEWVDIPRIPRTSEDARYRPLPGDRRVRTVYGTDSPSLFERQAYGTKGPPDVRISTAVYDAYYAANPEAWRAAGPYAPGENETFVWEPA